MVKRINIFLILLVFIIFVNVSYTSAAVGYNNKQGTTASITNVNNFTINGTSAIHNDLTGLQGGNSSQYYHLNQTDWDNIKTNQFLWVTSAGAGDIASVFTLNGFINLNNTLSGDIYLNFNQTHLNFTTDARYFTKAQWNVTNTSYRTLDNNTFSGNLIVPNLCYTNGTNCVAAGSGTVVGSGTQGFFPLWTNSSGLNNSLLQQNGLTITTTGIINATALKINGTDALTSFTETDALAYNGSLRGIGNFTFTGAGNFTGDIYSNSVNNLTIAFLYNSSGWIRDWGYLSGSNSSLVLKNTNWNSTNDLVPALNNSYDLGNSTNMFDELWVNTLNIITKISGSQIASSAITAGLIQAGTINATHIGVGAVNTTGILDNTIDSIDLGSNINLTMKKINLTYTGNLNITTQNITITNGTSGGRFCFTQDCSSYVYHNGTGLVFK